MMMEDWIAIARLADSVSQVDFQSRAIRGVVTLIWPYSSSTRSAAVLLAEPDYRLRKTKGQVRVQFNGAAARSIALSKVGIGDELVLRLDGAQRVEAVAGIHTPGKSVEVELKYKRRLFCEIFRQQQPYKKVDVDDETPSEPASSAASPESSHDFTPSLPTPLLSRINGLSTPISAAFHRRARVTSGELVDSPYDPFAGDEKSNDRKRQRLSWGSDSKWRVHSFAPTPSKRAGRIDWIQDEDLQTPKRSIRAAEVRPVTPTSPSPEEQESIRELLSTSSQLEEATRRYTQELVNAVSGDTEQEDCSDGPDEDPNDVDEQILGQSFGGDVRNRPSKLAVFNDNASIVDDHNLQQAIPSARASQPREVEESLSDALRQAEEDFLDLPSSSPPAQPIELTQSAAELVSSSAAISEPHMQDALHVDAEQAPEGTQMSPSLRGHHPSVQPLEETKFEDVETQQKDLQAQEITEMPPPAFKPAQISRLDTNVSVDSTSANINEGSPKTPKLAPQVSAGLPLPSPFPGQELSSYMEFAPQQDNGFCAPPPPNALPDYMFQAGYGFGSQSFMRDPSFSPQKHDQPMGSQIHEDGLGSHQEQQMIRLGSAGTDAVSIQESEVDSEAVLSESQDIAAPVQYPELLASGVDESQFHDLTAIAEESEEDDMPARTTAVDEVSRSSSDAAVVIFSSDQSSDDGEGETEKRDEDDVFAESGMTSSQSSAPIPRRQRNSGQPAHEFQDDSRSADDVGNTPLANVSEPAAATSEESESDYEMLSEEASDLENDGLSELTAEGHDRRLQTDEVSFVSEEEEDESEEEEDRWDDNDYEPVYPKPTHAAEQKESMKTEEEDSVLGPASQDHLPFSSGIDNSWSSTNAPAASQFNAVSPAISMPSDFLRPKEYAKAGKIVDGQASDEEVLPNSVPEPEQLNEAQSMEHFATEAEATGHNKAGEPTLAAGTATVSRPQTRRQVFPAIQVEEQSKKTAALSHEQHDGSLYEPSLRARPSVAFAPRVTRRRAAQEANSTAQFELQSSASLRTSQSQSFRTPRLKIEDTFEGNVHSDGSITTMAQSGSEDLRNAQMSTDEDNESEEEGSITPKQRPFIPQVDGAAESIPSSPPLYQQDKLVQDLVPDFDKRETAPSNEENLEITTQTSPAPFQTSQHFLTRAMTSEPSFEGLNRLPPTQDISLTTAHQSVHTADEGMSGEVRKLTDTRPKDRLSNDEAVAILKPWFGRDSDVVKVDSEDKERNEHLEPAALADEPGVTSSAANLSQSPQVDSQLPAFEEFSFTQSQRSSAKGILTDLCYYIPLANLISYLHVPSNSQGYPDNGVDLMAVVIKSATKPLRADSGPRDFYTTIGITDQSIFPQKITVQVFRPWRAALPKAENGDVILLRGFDVLSAKGTVGFTLRSGEGAAWCVWHWTGEESLESNGSFDGSLDLIGGAEKPWAKREARGGLTVAQREEVRGPPVDIGHGERENVQSLRSWWEDLKRHELQTQSQNSVTKSANGGVGSQGLESEVVLG